MPAKTTTKKSSSSTPRRSSTAASLPAGVKRSTLRAHPGVKRMIRDDRGFAPGGSSRARARRTAAASG